MNELVYPRERTLGTITLVLGILVWLLLIVGTFGGALVALLVGFVLYLFAQSAFIAYIKGNGVELSEAQFPDVHAHFVACCERLEIKVRPQAYVLNGGGALNAFATKFLGTEFVVLLSDVVDAMEQHPDGVRFYIGHELGHLRMKHLNGHLVRWPVLWLPLLGAAYSRARESTCDRHGLACSSSPENAARAMVALSAGPSRWKTLDLPAYLKQAQQTSGFWMSFHELIGGYPWLTKRAVRVMDTGAVIPKRSGFAYFLAAFVPFAGRLGAGFGMLIVVYIVGVLAAVAVPKYREYKVKAAEAVVAAQDAKAKVEITAVYAASQGALDKLGSYYKAKEEAPDSLDTAGLPATLADGSALALDKDNMVLSVTTPHGDLVFTPGVGDDGNVTWSCVNSDTIKAEQLPDACVGDTAEGRDKPDAKSE
jgi:Zn-dependent protease with chaperone function/Tfp pilus assembly major pilin PilA